MVGPEFYPDPSIKSMQYHEATCRQDVFPMYYTSAACLDMTLL